MDVAVTPRVHRNPCELAIDLQCQGLVLGDSCDLDNDARSVSRNRAGLGSGLELVLAGEPPQDREVWINVPVTEPFAARSPFTLKKREGRYQVVDRREGGRVYPVRLPAKPPWYDRATSSSTTPMSRVGVLQGSYLGIYVGPTCRFWRDDLNCRFCATGLNVDEKVPRTVEDVVETALAAKRESGVTFVHLNTGYQQGAAYRLMAPYVEALKRRVGVLVGVQVTPEGSREELDALLDLGTDHFSLCFEYFDDAALAQYCPGKHQLFGRDRFLDELAYCQSRLPKGACSGEIIAGLEPLDATFEAIDHITSLGAFPTVCIFRPLAGTALEERAPPGYADMRRVMKQVWECCRKRGIWIGLAPNLEVSLVVQPTDTAYLADRTLRDRWYMARNRLVRRLTSPLFKKRMATK